MKIEEAKLGQTVYVKGIITDIDKDEIFDLEIHTPENDFFVNSEDVFLKLNQPKPVVPQFVIDWVNDLRELDYYFEEWFDYDNQPKEVCKWLNLNNKRQADINALALVTLIVNGPDAVTVEKEKLYTVEIPNSNGLRMGICRTNDGICVVPIRYDDWDKKTLFQHTEQEICKDFDWAFRWAEEVTE